MAESSDLAADQSESVLLNERDLLRDRVRALEAEAAARQQTGRLLATQLAIARVLSKSAAGADVIERTLSGVCEALGWSWSALWTTDRTGTALVCTRVWTNPDLELDAFAALSHRTRLHRGDGVPGQAWERGEPVWVADVTQLPAFPRLTAAMKDGLHAALALPILVRDEVVGVIEFLSQAIQPPDAGLLGLMRAVSSQLGQALEREQMMRALAASDARKAAVLETALDSIISIDGSQQVIEWNPAAERTFGYTREEALGQVLTELIVPPDLRSRHYQGFARHLATGASTILDQRLEMRGQRRDGTIFPVELTVTRADIDEQPLFTAHLRDITARTQSEAERAALLEDAHGARLVAEAAGRRMAQMQALTAAFSRALTPSEVAEVVITQGLEVLGAGAGRVLLATDDGQALTLVGAVGYSPEMMARWERVPLEHPVPLAEAARTQTPLWFNSRAALTSRYPAITRVPDLETEAFAALPLTVNERAIGALALSFAAGRDFTVDDQAFMMSLAQHCAQALERARLFEAEQRARAAAEQAARQRAEFLSVASHELRTPLTSMKAAVQLLVRRAEQGALSETQTAHLATQLLSQTDRLGRLVADLLDADRIQGGRLELRPEHVDLAALAGQVLARFEDTPERTARHELVLETLASVEGYWDPLRLDQVLTNLVSNALKYSPAGGVVRVTVSRNATGAEIVVSDEGLGIAPSDQLQLFQPFVRGQQRSGHIAGVGLGLYITQQIVAQHGGDITLTSQPDVGTQVRVQLPLALAPHGAPGD